MQIDINHDYREEMTADLPIEQLAMFVLEQEQRPEATEVSITFVDDDTIAQMNEEYRGKVGPTDVLSFECDGVDGDEDFADAVVDAGDVMLLGDIVISVDTAERQCAGFGTTFPQEVEILTIHGLLHLCGYDHIEDDEAAIMEAREDELLAAWRESRK